MMLRAGVVVILVFVFVLSGMEGFGQDSVILGDLSVDMMSKYIFRGRLINDEFVLQPALKLMSGDMAGGILMTVDLSDEHGASWDVTEWRLWGEYVFSAKDLEIAAGFTYYDYPNLTLGSTQEVYGRMGLPGIHLEPAVMLVYDFDELDGWYARFQAAYMADSDTLWLRLEGSLGVGSKDYNNRVFGVDDLAIVDLNLTLSTELVLYGDILLEPKVSATFLLNSDIKDAAGEDWYLYGGVTVKTTF